MTSMVRVYRYRLYPTRTQDATMRETLYRLRELYNAALQERRDAYQKGGVSLSGYSQMAELRGVREVRPEYAKIHTHLLQDAITRLDLAFRAFFRRIKSGEMPVPGFEAENERRQHAALKTDYAADVAEMRTRLATVEGAPRISREEHDRVIRHAKAVIGKLLGMGPASGMCSHHQLSEDPTCRICYGDRARREGPPAPRPRMPGEVAAPCAGDCDCPCHCQPAPTGDGITAEDLAITHAEVLEARDWLNAHGWPNPDDGLSTMAARYARARGRGSR